MNEYSEPNGYVDALKAAGFDVIDYEQFGSYQGDLIVFVRLNGKYGFVIEQYGSCSGCDTFEAECPKPTPETLKVFGERYLDAMKSFDQALVYVKKHADWDLEAKAMVEFVEKRRYEIDFDKIVKED